MRTVLLMLAGYLIGSVPFAIIIGKVFYRTDVRKFGSGNPGGGNTGRVLGKRAGLSVMTLDLLKVSLVVFLAVRLSGSDAAVACAALAAGFGHCFSVFASFRGGKAVAAMYGFLFGLWVFDGRPPLYFLLPLTVFMIVLYFGRMTSLASMVSSAAAAFFICSLPESLPIKAALVVYAALILYRHSENIGRMRQHRENRVTWIP